MSKIIKLKVTGDLGRTKLFLYRASDLDKVILPILERYGQLGVDNLRTNTPKDTGRTAESWYYKVRGGKGTYQLVFDNTYRTNEGTPVAILLQYGHGTRGGTYVTGIDFIDPALQPIFDELKERIWEEVVKL